MCDTKNEGRATVARLFHVRQLAVDNRCYDYLGSSLDVGLDFHDWFPFFEILMLVAQSQFRLVVRLRFVDSFRA